MMDIDPNLVFYYQLGLGIGVVVLTTLILFPGKPLGIAYGPDVPVNVDGLGGSDGIVDGTASEDVLLAKLSEQWGLPVEQVKTVLSRHKNNAETERVDMPWYRVLNRLVYVVSFALLAYVINRDYDNYVSFWFGYWFPKEAGTLGLHVPEAKGK